MSLVKMGDSPLKQGFVMVVMKAKIHELIDLKGD
jgi:hypothetical protein